MEFGWWNKDPELGKIQVRAIFHGGNLTWEHKVGRFTSWEAHPPGSEDWAQLIEAADNRYNRRLISPRHLRQIKDHRPPA